MSLVGLHVSGAIKERLFKSDIAKSNIGSKLGIGFDYEYQDNAFLFNTGLTFSWHKIGNTVSDTVYTYLDQKDTQSEKFMLSYFFKYRKETFSFFSFDIPLLFGTQYKFFYAMAGPKFGVIFQEFYTPSVRITTIAEYPFSDIDISNIDIHGMRYNASLNHKIKYTDIRPFITLSAEIGINILNLKDYDNAMGYSTQLKLGIFANYSLFPENTKDELQLYEIPEENKYDFDKIAINPFFSTTEANKMKIHNFVVGIRLAFMIDVFYLHQRKSPCISCY